MTPPEYDESPNLGSQSMEEATYLVDAVFRLGNALSRIGNLRLAPWKLSLSSYAALSVMASRPNLSFAQLARRCFVQPQSIHRIVSQLETRGFVVRGSHEDSERAVGLSLTQEGREALEQMTEVVNKINASLTQAMGASEIKFVNEALRTSAKVVEAEVKILSKTVTSRAPNPADE